MAETASTTSDDYAGLSAKQTIDAMSDDKKKALKSWYFYDWANQAYALTVMTVIAPALMAALYNTATGTQSGDSFYAWVLTFSMLFVVITAPALGVIADKMPIKKKLLKWYTVVGIIFTALMGAAPYFGSQGYLILALMYTIGTIGFTGGNVIYYSFMPYLAPRKCQDHVSTWGYAYGFIGGSMILIFHLIVLLGFSWDTNFKMAIIFSTSAIWWWGFGLLMFKWTPEPEIPSSMEWKGLKDATKVAYSQVYQTFKEIKRFKVLAFFLLAYLLFYDGVNTIASMASAFGESVLRLDQSMNVLLLLTVNIVAIPMTIVFGKLADIKGTKFALMTALMIYCFVAVVAAGFAPLELEGEEDADRYDFTFEWDEDAQVYELTTLYDRGYENWVGETSAGDSEFRDNFQEYFPANSTDYAKESSGSSTIGTGLLVCLMLLAFVAIIGGSIAFIQSKELGKLGVILMVSIVGLGVLGASMLADQAEEDEVEMHNISAADGAQIFANFDNASDHRFSIIFVDGPLAGQDEIGDRHPTKVDQGGPVDAWAEIMRDNVWKPLNLGVSMQWIILGMFVGVAMGSAGAQARSMFSQLVPETRTSEFFGFFGFLGKSAAMIGTFLYGIASTTFDSRVAILSITVVILAGTYLTSKVDLEEGIRVAEEEDAKNRAAAAATESN
ncbi:MAG: MFS transporter [Candidatus Thermoplasmatota archaeon]|nr:MFS transporter [Candidatus Thermoplasmatota archaeon]DAC59087.1 MAG TPA: MFS transporter [Candidatus Poseidoniales archaeon]HII50608.1 MFS transporter [Candidatus Poseidoniaceae archaeon]